MAQALDLPQIEAIVTEIEKEKEAGAYFELNMYVALDSDDSFQMRRGNVVGWPQQLQVKLL
jgi:hypothetical protein